MTWHSSNSNSYRCCEKTTVLKYLTASTLFKIVFFMSLPIYIKSTLPLLFNLAYSCFHLFWTYVCGNFTFSVFLCCQHLLHDWYTLNTCNIVFSGQDGGPVAAAPQVCCPPASSPPGAPHSRPAGGGAGGGWRGAPGGALWTHSDWRWYAQVSILGTTVATGLIISETLKPIFHQAIQFALGTFQIISFYQCKH